MPQTVWVQFGEGVIFCNLFYSRDAHFVIGEEDETKTEEDDKITSDPKYVTS